MEKIKHINKRLGLSSDLEVKKLGDNFFEIVYNDPFDQRYDSGTRIRTKVNSEGFTKSLSLLSLRMLHIDLSPQLNKI